MDYSNKLLKVTGIRNVSKSAYIVEFEKNGLAFLPGQYICIGMEGVKSMREYTIYSGSEDHKLEILVKEVEEGLISKKLKELKPGDVIPYDGPKGNFTLNKYEIDRKKFFFISSGTGIAPFHSYIRTYPKLQYVLLHGIPHIDEAYESDHYEKGNYISCTSRDNKGTFSGRVTNYLKQNPPDKDCEFYLCGNGNMIYEAVDILRDYDIKLEQIHFEVYF